MLWFLRLHSGFTKPLRGRSVETLTRRKHAENENKQDAVRSDEMWDRVIKVISVNLIDYSQQICGPGVGLHHPNRRTA